MNNIIRHYPGIPIVLPDASEVRTVHRNSSVPLQAASQSETCQCKMPLPFEIVLENGNSNKEIPPKKRRFKVLTFRFLYSDMKYSCYFFYSGASLSKK